MGQTFDGCDDLPASGILCESECSQYWWQCAANGVAYMMSVPAGARCKNSNFVVEAECSDVEPTRTPGPAPAADPTRTPAPAPTPAPALPQLPTQSPPATSCEGCGACLWGNGQCYTDAGEEYCL